MNFSEGMAEPAYIRGNTYSSKLGQAFIDLIYQLKDHCGPRLDVLIVDTTANKRSFIRKKQYTPTKRNLAEYKLWIPLEEIEKHRREDECHRWSQIFESLSENWISRFTSTFKLRKMMLNHYSLFVILLVLDYSSAYKVITCQVMEYSFG